MWNFGGNDVEKPEPDFSQIENPTVRAYMMQKYQDEQALRDAKDKRDMGAYSQSIGDSLTNWGNGNKKAIFLQNRMKDLGKPQQVLRPEEAKYDQSGLNQMLDRDVADAKEKAANSRANFWDDAKVTQYGQEQEKYRQDLANAKEEADPNSATSKQYQALAKKFMPTYDWSSVPASKLKQSMPILEKAYQVDENRQRFKESAAQRALDLAYKKDAQKTWTSTGQVDKSGRLILLNPSTAETKAVDEVGTKPKEEGTKALNSSDKQRFDNVRMALDAVKGMRAAWEAGDNTFSVIGDNDYTMNLARFEEALGRMQSGGAIGKEEGARFRAMAPQMLDSEDTQRQKLDWIQKEMEDRMNTLGVDPATVQSSSPGSSPKRQAVTVDQLP